jgi:hypothetical protein
MPEADIFDISTRRAIRDSLTLEQEKAAFIATVMELTADQRDLLRLTVMAFWPAAGAAAWPGSARETPDGPDAELIRQCDHLHAVQRALDATYELIPEDDERQRRAVIALIAPLSARQSEIHDRILELSKGPTTLEGARAAARAVLGQYPDGLEEARQDCNLAAWLSISLAEYVAGTNETLSWYA